MLHDQILATGVIRNKVCHIIHHIVKDHPAVLLGVVLRYVAPSEGLGPKHGRDERRKNQVPRAPHPLRVTHRRVDPFHATLGVT